MDEDDVETTEDGIETAKAEAERNNPPWPGVCRLRVTDRGWMAPQGDWIFVRQSLARPVAEEFAIDEDSNGSIPHARFNLEDLVLVWAWGGKGLRQL